MTGTGCSQSHLHPSHRKGLAVVCAILPLCLRLHLARYSAWLDPVSRMFVLTSPTASADTRNLQHPLQPPVGCKSTWWHPTFASRIAQAPIAPIKSSS